MDTPAMIGESLGHFRILDKLGFDSRVQIATWLARNEHLN